jgi:hypothetical protein
MNSEKGKVSLETCFQLFKSLNDVQANYFNHESLTIVINRKRKEQATIPKSHLPKSN